MKTKTCIIAILLAAGLTNSRAQDTWTQKADFGGTARSRATGFSSGKGYLGTGSDASGLTKDFWEYDPATNTWTQKADFGGTIRSVAVGFFIGGKGYIGTGADATTLYKDFWEYTPATAQTSWIELAPTGGPPRPRAIHVAVYDPATNRMTIHGGTDGTNALNDAWVLTNADGTESASPTWTKLLPANPLTRTTHSAVYDSVSNRMVVFAGRVSPLGQDLNDVWVLTNANGNGGDPEWVQLAPSGDPPAPRHDPTAVYDSASNRMTIFGGGSTEILDDVWVLTNANGTEPAPPSWIQLFPRNQISPHYLNTTVYDAQSNRMIVFGGTNDTFSLNDVWVLTNANGLGGNPEWIELAPDGTPPSPRVLLAAAYDPTTNRMVIFGGADDSGTLNDTWVLTNANGVETDTPAWVPLAPVGTLPPARNQLTATYSVSTNRLSIFAGDNSFGCCNLLNDVWVLVGANGIAPIVSLSQTDLAFKRQLVGTTSKPQSVTLTNTGDATLTISSIAASGDFIAQNNCGSSLPAGVSCTIRVAFNPSAKGVRTGTVTITDDAANSPQTIALTGTGTVVQLSPLALNFGEQIVGTTSDPLTATVTNIGSEDLHISGIGLGGANFGDFAETTTCGSRLAAGRSCTIDVTFTPGARGHRHASLKIVDDGGASPQAVPRRNGGSKIGFVHGPAATIIADNLSKAGWSWGCVSALDSNRSAQIVI